MLLAHPQAVCGHPMAISNGFLICLGRYDNIIANQNYTTYQIAYKYTPRVMLTRLSQIGTTSTIDCWVRDVSNTRFNAYFTITSGGTGGMWASFGY